MTDKTERHYARNESMRSVFSVLGIPPEELAYTMAAYSRSRRSFLETNSYINSQKAAKFLETFYFSYGHRSIADMAHVPMAIENISILAAIEVVAEQLWDGQERSTRYQDFSVTGYCVPDEIETSRQEEIYVAAADSLFAAYEEVSHAAYDHYRATTPQPDQMDAKSYERTLRARAFDVGRYALPLATHTSVGQITSARTLEQQISRLLSSPFGEIRRVGKALQEANRTDSRNPKEERLRAHLDVLETSLTNLALDDDGAKALREIRSLLTPTPAAPTLVKYTAPHTYRREIEEVLRQVYGGLLGRVKPESTGPVTLIEVTDPSVESVAKLLYTVGRHPFAQIVHHVMRLTPQERTDLLDLVFEKRGDHDLWLDEFRVGYLNFDIVMDIGSLRDLHRHRRCQQLRQPYSGDLGYETPNTLADAPVREVYDEAIQNALEVSRRIDKVSPPHGAYVLPLATRSRSLFSMDLAELAYITELRTRPTGHDSYRRIAYAMYRETVKRYPDFAPYVRVVEPEHVDLMER